MPAIHPNPQTSPAREIIIQYKIPQRMQTIAAGENPMSTLHKPKLIAALSLLLALTLLLPSCGRKTNYDQSSAQATVDSLAEMLETGDVVRIPSLIHTDDENLTKTLHAVGVILMRIQNLSTTIKEKYPDEVDELLKKIEADATAQLEKAGNDRGQTDWGDRFQALLVDPADAFHDLLDRVEVVYASDEMQALLFDGKPALGGIILLQNPDDGKWYFDWPDQIPGLDTAMPKTEAEWKILRSILKTVANGVDWTKEEIEEGNAKNLNKVYEEVAKNVGPNLVIGWFIYQQALKKRPTDDDG